MLIKNILFISLLLFLLFLNSRLCRIFFISLSGAQIKRFDGFLTHENTPYNCPYEKHGYYRSNTHMSIVCLCDLFMAIAKAKRTGNRKLLIELVC